MYTACPMSLRVCGQFGTPCIWCVNVMIYRNISHVPEVTESASMNVAFCVCVRACVSICLHGCSCIGLIIYVSRYLGVLKKLRKAIISFECMSVRPSVLSCACSYICPACINSDTTGRILIKFNISAFF